MIVRAATDHDILRVSLDMRAADAREVFAARFDDNRGALATDLAANKPFCIGFLALCDDEGAPIALLAAALASPTRAEVIMIATDRWRVIARAATRFALETAIPCFLDAPGVGILRAECKAWVGNRVACRWLEALGFRREAVLRCYGKGGEDFAVYARLHPQRDRQATGRGGQSATRRNFAVAQEPPCPTNAP